MVPRFDIQAHGVDDGRLARFAPRLARLNRHRPHEFQVRLFDGAELAELGSVLAPPANACLDVDCNRNVTFLLPVADFVLRLSTATANRVDVADCVIGALQDRHPHLAAKAADMRYALQEAVGNAVIHGNLGMDSGLRISMEGLREFALQLDQRLADPAHAQLPITISARIAQDGIAIVVDDRGAGFDPLAVRPPPSAAAGGMGLGIIRKCARTVSFGRGGRRITMVF
jgi:anti-sigma regulatory factor (Ser/Thr protein kinase)